MLAYCVAACTCSCQSQILVGLLQKRDNIFFLAFLIEYGLKINHFFDRNSSNINIHQLRNTYYKQKFNLGSNRAML